MLEKKFAIIPDALLNDKKLSIKARFLYCYLCSKYDGWEFYHAEIAKDLGISVKTLLKCIEELKKSGWLKTEHKENKNIYEICEIKGE